MDSIVMGKKFVNYLFIIKYFKYYLFFCSVFDYVADQGHDHLTPFLRKILIWIDSQDATIVYDGNI